MNGEVKYADFMVNLDAFTFLQERVVSLVSMIIKCCRQHMSLMLTVSNIILIPEPFLQHSY